MKAYFIRLICLISIGVVSVALSVLPLLILDYLPELLFSMGVRGVYVHHSGDPISGTFVIATGSLCVSIVLAFILEKILKGQFVKIIVLLALLAQLVPVSVLLSRFSGGALSFFEGAVILVVALAPVTALFELRKGEPTARIWRLLGVLGGLLSLFASAFVSLPLIAILGSSLLTFPIGGGFEARKFWTENFLGSNPDVKWVFEHRKEFSNLKPGAYAFSDKGLNIINYNFMDPPDVYGLLEDAEGKRVKICAGVSAEYCRFIEG